MKHDLKEGLRDCQSNQSLKTKRQSASVLARSENGISSKQCFLILNRANENTHRTYASTRFFFVLFFFQARKYGVGFGWRVSQKPFINISDRV